MINKNRGNLIKRNDKYGDIIYEHPIDYFNRLKSEGVVSDMVLVEMTLIDEHPELREAWEKFWPVYEKYAAWNFLNDK